MAVLWQGKIIGEVIRVETNTKDSLLRIQRGDKTFLLPFIAHFIAGVDVANKQLVAINIEGLYD